MKISLLHKARSYFSPVILWKGSSPISPVLELLLYRGRFQLATTDALYSDGDRYRPLVTGFGAVREHLDHVQSVLVLGAGIGSAVDVLRRFGAHPEITLVELDPVVAHWAKAVLPAQDRDRVSIVVEDAQMFVQQKHPHFDIVVVDVFTGREAAPFVTDHQFLACCRALLSSKGIFLLNYMQNPGAGPWQHALAEIEMLFPDPQVLTFGPNRVVVWHTRAIG